MPEDYKWIQLPPKKEFLILKHCTTYIEYQENGYTKNSKSLYFKNLNGRLAAYNQIMESCVYKFCKIEFCIKYIITCLFLKKKHCVKQSNSPFLTFLLYPVGWIAYMCLLKSSYKKR